MLCCKRTAGMYPVKPSRSEDHECYRQYLLYIFLQINWFEILLYKFFYWHSNMAKNSNNMTTFNISARRGEFFEKRYWLTRKNVVKIHAPFFVVDFLNFRLLLFFDLPITGPPSLSPLVLRWYTFLHKPIVHSCFRLSPPPHQSLP